MPYESPCAKAAKVAVDLFRLNQWTWRDNPAPPDELDIAATFSALAWELRRSFGFQGDGQIHTSASGRLLVTLGSNGDARYAVEVGSERA